MGHEIGEMIVIPAEIREIWTKTAVFQTNIVRIRVVGRTTLVDIECIAMIFLLVLTGVMGTRITRDFIH